MHYIYWALLGMAGYSGLAAISVAAYRGDFQVLLSKGLLSEQALWSYATGIALAIAVCSLFRALSLGPVSTVVPIYGMFVVGGSLLGVLFLNESLPWTKVLGILTAVLSIFLITR